MPRPLLKFIISTVLIYVLLVVLYKSTPLGNTYQQFFINSNAWWHTAHGENGKVEAKLANPNDPTRKHIAVYSIYNEKQKQKAISIYKANPNNKTVSYDVDTVNLDVWNFAALGLILMLTLIIAFPSHWKQKILALIVGFALYHIFLWIKMGMMLNREFIKYPHLENNGLSPFLGKVNNYLYAIMENIGFSLFISSLIAILLCMNKNGFDKLTQKNK